MLALVVGIYLLGILQWEVRDVISQESVVLDITTIKNNIQLDNSHIEPKTYNSSKYPIPIGTKYPYIDIESIYFEIFKNDLSYSHRFDWINNKTLLTKLDNITNYKNYDFIEKEKIWKNNDYYFRRNMSQIFSQSKINKISILNLMNGYFPNHKIVCKFKHPVFGIGMQKTGTLTANAVLHKLGYRHSMDHARHISIHHWGFDPFYSNSLDFATRDEILSVVLWHPHIRDYLYYLFNNITIMP